MNNPFLSLKHPNYRYYIIGMLVSNVGTWMQNVAQPWLAYQITDSAFQIGLVSAMQFLPTLLISVLAGAVIENQDKRRLLFYTQTVLFATTLTMAVLVFTGLIQYWHILILATMMGIANSFDMPIRQSFVVQLVPKTDLMNAIALNSTVFNLARIVGPAIAGIILAYYGTGICFLVNSLSFLAVILSLFFIHPLQAAFPLHKEQINLKNVLHNVREGFSYVSRRPEIMVILSTSFIVSFFGMNNNVLLPVFVTKVLHMQETSYGFITTCMGVGSFAGAILLASKSAKGPKRFHLTFAPLLLGICLIAVGLFNQYLLTLLIYAAVGYFFVSYAATANTSIQLLVDEEYRSRVMSIYTLVNAGTIPFGSLFTGLVVSGYGASSGFIVNGAFIAIIMTLFCLKIYFGKS